MKEVILDCREMDTIEKAHNHIMERLNFPKYYGKNLDALYDILSTYDEEINIKFLNFESLFKSLGEYAISIIEIFREVEQENTKIRFEAK